jgi:polymorphic membrane protein
VILLALTASAGCAGERGSARGATTPVGNDVAAAQATASAAPAASSAAPSAPASSKPPVAAGPPAGNPNGKAAIPAEARAVDTSKPTRTIGNGSAASCTSEAVVSAVAAGGIITFNCGPDPITITMNATAKVRNDHGPKVVLDGGGRVTLSGGGQRRILYLNTCDAAQVHTTSHCQDQDSPQLTVQNLTFVDGNSTGEHTEGGGGGAIFVRGGRFKAVNTRFFRNRCDSTGPDLGGAAIRVLDQSRDLPVYIVNSTFGGSPGQGGICSNGGALSSIGVSWVVLNSVMSYNSAIGRGQNPALPNTPGGGSGGAIYTDGNLFTVTLDGTIIENNKANEGGGAIFFVSNDRSGTMTIQNSRLKGNPSAGFETAGLPGIFFLGARKPTITNSTLSK